MKSKNEILDLLGMSVKDIYREIGYKGAHNGQAAEVLRKVLVWVLK